MKKQGRRVETLKRKAHSLKNLQTKYLRQLWANIVDEISEVSADRTDYLTYNEIDLYNMMEDELVELYKLLDSAQQEMDRRKLEYNRWVVEPYQPKYIRCPMI